MIDPQLKRGLLDICVLSLLQRGDSYGYQLIKDLSGYVPVSESTLYPILRRLEAAGSLTVYSEEYHGRLRKFYRITDAGRRQIRTFMERMEELRRIFDLIKECAEDDKGTVS